MRQYQPLVGTDMGRYALLSAGPEHPERVHLLGCSQPKMQPRLHLAAIAIARLQLAHLLATIGAQFDPCAQRVEIAILSLELNAQPRRGFNSIAIEHRALHAGNQQILTPVAVVVAPAQPPARALPPQTQ